ncbi:MAG: hypothetical protein JXA21_22180 [Anaerolineae bacterium]|nr:hypothetical protein [Anaerolineae bacterium]
MLKNSLTMCLAVTLILLLSSGVVSASGAIVGPGDIAFVGYNADAADDFAFVLLGDAASEQQIYFTDNEWNGQPVGSGGAFNDLFEGEMTWTAPTGGLIAGTVVVINNTSTTPTTNYGSVSTSSPINLNASDEVLYAFLGSDESTPIAFLAAIANGGFNDTNGTLGNTGLTEGTDALNLGAADDDCDIGAYIGSRINQDNKAGYLPQINNAANWVVQDGNGDQSADGIAPDLPFDTTPFTKTNAVVIQGMGGRTSAFAGLAAVFVLAGGLVALRKRK